MMEGQGWFTGEVERSLMEGRADVAVHSAKDLPTTLGPGLEVAAIPLRGDPCDAVVSADGSALDDLPAGATVGTSSERRQAMVRALHPRLRAVDLRGNVDTRLAKLEAGEVDALLLAAAGLERLGLAARITEKLDPRRFVPAPAQGALALEARASSESAAVTARVADREATTAVAAERAVLRQLGGGCLLPLGAWARVEEGRLVLTASLVASEELRVVELSGSLDAPEQLGREVADRLR